MKRVARCHELVALGGSHTAVAGGDVSRVVEILGTCVPVDEKDSFGNTPLHRAVWQGDADIVGVLLRHGADALVQRSDGKAALDLVELRVKCCGANPPDGLSSEYGDVDSNAISGLLREACKKSMTDPDDRFLLLNELSCSSLASKSTCAPSEDLDMEDKPSWNLGSKSTYCLEE